MSSIQDIVLKLENRWTVCYDLYWIMIKFWDLLKKRSDDKLFLAWS